MKKWIAKYKGNEYTVLVVPPFSLVYSMWIVDSVRPPNFMSSSPVVQYANPVLHVEVRRDHPIARQKA